MPLVYLAGCPDPEAVQPFHRGQSLRKPFQPAQLFRLIRQLIP
jgi:hypothetical protein